MAKHELLVRCASCGRNFESRRAGHISCPVCKAEIYLEPPPGFPLEPEESEEPAEAEAEADSTPSPVMPEESLEPDPGDEAPEEMPEADDDLSAEALARLEEIQRRLSKQQDFVPAWQTKEGSLLGRFWTTVRQIYGNPSGFFAAIEPRGLKGALSFGWLVCTWAMAFFGIYGLWQLSQAGPEQMEQLREAAAAGGNAVKPEQVIETLHGMFMLSLFASPLLGLLNVFVTAGLLHLGVMLVAERHRGFAATFHATAYGFVPLLLMAIPFVGHLIGGLWAIVLQVIAVGQVHRMGPGRASLAVLMPVTGIMLLLWAAM